MLVASLIDLYSLVVLAAVVMSWAPAAGQTGWA